MRTKNIEALVALAASQPQHDISQAVTESTELEFVVPSLLRAKVAALGYTTRLKQGQHVVTVQLFKGEALIASGTSDTEADALLHAALGYVRERRIDELVAQGVPKAEAAQRAVTNT